MNTASKALILTSFIVITFGISAACGNPPASEKPTKCCTAGKKLSEETTKQDSEDSYDSGSIIETPPSFQGGNLETFRTWFMHNLKYPLNASENGIQGNVLATFVIKTDGTLSDITILSSPDESLSTEVISVLQISPKWTPAINMKGERIEILYYFPVNFRCQ